MKLLILSNFSFLLHVFNKLSAVEASGSVFMRERVKASADSVVLKMKLLMKLTHEKQYALLF